MSETLKASVVVAGAGPVGMSVAMAAAMRGVDVVVIEPRAPGEPPSAKCNTVAARTLEIFRQFGCADAVRAAGLPDAYPTDTIYCTSLTGFELTRLKMPARDERAEDGFLDSAWLTPEPMVRISQLYLEPILFAQMQKTPGIRIISRASVERYEQDDAGVKVFCRHEDGSGEFVVEASFLVGCDGGRSPIRKAMGVNLVGDAELGRTRSSLVRSPGIRDLFAGRRPAWMSWIVSPKARGTVVAIDGQDTWLVHRSLPAGEADFEALDFDQSIRDVLGVGDDFEWTVLNHEDWIGRRLVAERFRDGNVFIAGDAAHLWVPFAGYGMNAGIADGVNLAWALSAVLNGWAPRAMLDVYEAERHPITEQVSRFAMAKVMENMSAMGGGPVPGVLVEEGAQGDAVRGMVGARLYEVNVPQMSPEGLNFGYYYEGSPIIVYDGEAPPAYSMGEVTPSTVPGCRMPHFWIDRDAGLSVYDLIGLDYALVRFNPEVDVEPLLSAAKARGVPFKVVDAERPASPAVFAQDLLIVRHDQQIAWRGDELPVDVGGLVEKLRGAVAVAF